MAATNKSKAILAEKQSVASEISNLQLRAKAACGRVPKSVIAGDAIAAANWRDTAEKAYAKCDQGG